MINDDEMDVIIETEDYIYYYLITTFLMFLFKFMNEKTKWLYIVQVLHRGPALVMIWVPLFNK